MRLGGEVIDLVRQDLLDDADEAGGIGKIPMVKDKFPFLLMRILVEMIDAVCIEQRCTAFDAMDLIPFIKQKLSQIRPILTSYTGNQCFLHKFPLSIELYSKKTIFQLASDAQHVEAKLFTAGGENEAL